ncbi:2'-5'-oligoadenylate synthase 2-like [Dysidea avara]|uniref:2'-5'-oligoadenylate synthase 2-like n=1 Tax=Dysidea avara TaxID=196820 RepID=UPI0033177745
MILLTAPAIFEESSSNRGSHCTSHCTVPTGDNNERRRHGGIIQHLTINEVFEGGSMGKGTTVPGDFDVDLVIYSSSIDQYEAARKGDYKTFLEAIHSYLSVQLSGYYTKKAITNYGLQFNCSGVSIDVLLSPYFTSMRDYCSFLDTISRARLPTAMFSCSASRWQVQFVKGYPDQVMEYIRQVKAWRNRMWDDRGLTDGRPKSYLLELLVIKAYENSIQSSTQMSSFTAIVGATPFRPAVTSANIKQELIRLVCDARIAIIWQKYYTVEMVQRFGHHPPYIIDPANPSNNVHYTGIVRVGYGDPWRVFRSMIHTLDICKLLFTDTVTQLVVMATGKLSIITSDIRRVIQRVVRVLQDSSARRIYGGKVSQLVIYEVFEGGSTKKGTTVPGEPFDVDLIIYCTSIDPHQAAKEKGYEMYYWSISSYLNAYLGNYQRKEINKYNLQFVCDNVNIDILLSPLFNTPTEYYSFLVRRSTVERSIFSCSASKWQVEFLENYPDIVLQCIKKFKVWRNEQWDHKGIKTSRPKSYLLELLVIKAYENSIEMISRMASYRVTRSVTSNDIQRQLVALVCDDLITVYWTHFYDENTIRKFNHDRPFIIDPANPSNNVYYTGILKRHGGGDWSKFQALIATLELWREFKYKFLIRRNDARKRFVSDLIISEVFKGGSVGKCTTAPGDFNVDLVIYSRVKLKSYKTIIEKFDQYLRSQLKGQHYATRGTDDHSLQFKYCSVGVDLLISPYFDSKQQYYSFLETIDKQNISLFNCSAAKWQVEFVQHYHKAHEYIKQAKAWRNNTWRDDEDGRPSSYLMELLVIKAYENGGSRDEPLVIKQELVKLVCNEQITVYWTVNYTADKIWKFNSRQPPYIIDPASPSNNLYRSGITKLLTYASRGYGGDWSKFQSEIHSLDLCQRYYTT